MAIKPHRGDLMHCSQVEQQPCAFCWQGRKVEFLSINGGARIELDTGLGPTRPIDEMIEADLLRASPLRAEAHVPDPGECELAFGSRVIRRCSAGSVCVDGFAEDDE